jgi:magnesium chelatase subunit D
VTSADLVKLLACAALEPGLDGILLLDQPARHLPAIAQRLAEMLSSSARVLLLGTHENDDDLWLSYRKRSPDGTEEFTVSAGQLARDGPLVVVVPDLARLSLAATRAAVSTLTSPVVLLQRHGISSCIPNSMYWLATCASADIGQVSAHLLERFTTRLPAAPVVESGNPVDPVLDFLAGHTTDLDLPDTPSSWTRMFKSEGPLPVVTTQAVERSVALFEPSMSARRPIALLRLARAFARLEDSDRVEPPDVDAAAALIGLSAPLSVSPAVATPPRPEPSPKYRRATPPQHPATRSTPQPAQERQANPIAASPPIVEVSLPEPISHLTIDGTRAPYPEDSSEPQREAAPLAIPWQRRSGKPPDRGEIIGTTPTSRIVDIAWVATLREAAKYQKIRRRSNSPQESFLLTSSDLRRYRRSPKAEHLVVLVLDHTCHKDWDWLPALALFLREAYVRRSAVCLIEVGSKRSPSALRAERSLARSVLDPQTAAALDRKASSATPLAHGLELARLTLHHSLQHGDAPVTEAVLIVVTDGLGNVPLDASQRDVVNGQVGAQGIDDALAVGEVISGLDRVRSVIVQPPHTPYPDVLQGLAQALGPQCTVISGAEE